MHKTIGIAVLAAGKGTRLKVDIPKAICPLQGQTLLDYVLKELNQFVDLANLEASIGVVVGHKKELVLEHLKKFSFTNLSFPIQSEQLGTGHALQCFFSSNDSFKGHEFTLVTCADTPLVNAGVFSRLLAELVEDKSLVGIAATCRQNNPFGYGRIVRDKNGSFSIVEEKDASSEIKEINEINSGVYIFRTKHILKNLFNVTNDNKNGEYYLTDLFKPEYKVRASLFDNADLFIGVNTMMQLEDVARIVQKSKINQLQSNGVRFLNSSSCYIEDTVSIEAGTVVYPNVTIMGHAKIGANVVIESSVVIKNSIIENNAEIYANSYLEGAHVRANATIGPMARLRPGADIGEKAKIGNFVEIKKSVLEKEVKVSHLSYVGDAKIGARTNIGCGFITCNYDGVKKHESIIGHDSFIGSDCQLIAPINIGSHAFIGSGSTINQDVPDNAFAIARQKQITKEGMAERFIPKKS